MSFEAFVEIYRDKMKNRIREHTWQTKNAIIDSKILPFFGSKKINEIQPKDIITWQNELLRYKKENGESYSPVYLKTVHDQLSAIFKESLNKSRLSAWHTSCLHIFRHITQKFLDIRQYAFKISMQSAEKSDCAICAPDLISASLILL